MEKHDQIALEKKGFEEFCLSWTKMSS